MPSLFSFCNLSAASFVVPTHSLDLCLWGVPIIPLLIHQPAYLSNWVSCLLPDIKCSLYVDDLAIYYSSSHMPSIERKLQHSLNRLGRWCDQNGFKFSPTKTICVYFCQLRKHHLDPQLYLNGTHIPTIGEAKFIGIIFDSKLSLILQHITSLKSRCTKSLDLIQVLSNTTWGADRKVLLRLYRALIVVLCMVLSYIKRLDTVHNQGLRLCLGEFRTSPVQSLYVEANEPPLDMRRSRLSMQYGVKLMSNEVNPAYSAVFQSDIVATYESKERAIKPLGLRIERHLDGVGFHTHVIAPYTVMKTPPWKLIVPTVCFDLCKYKKSHTDPILYRLHYSELLESFTDYTHIFAD